MSRALLIKRKILSTCESLSIKEIEKTFDWLNDLLTSLDFQIYSVDSYGNDGLDTLKAEETVSFTYRKTFGSESRDENLTINCKPNSKPFMTTSFSFSGSSSNPDEESYSSSYANLYLGGKAWNTENDVREGLSDWIEEIRSSSIYQELSSNLDNGGSQDGDWLDTWS